jgi:hypothetical protein
MYYIYIMDLIKDYSDDEIKKMVHIYNKYNQQKEYRRNYYNKRYNEDPEYKNKIKLSNKKYLESKKKVKNIT